MRWPWWLRPTKEGRFYAYHHDCHIRHSQVMSSWAGYFTYVECAENRKHYSFKHDHERLYYDTGYPFAPPSYW